MGAGAGSIADYLCRQVGPQGRVTAIDLDTRFVEEIDADNLDVLQADVTTIDLPRNTFDLVHCRALLMHLPTRHRVLDALVAALRPGGWLLVEEGDSYPVSAAGSGLYSDVLEMVLVDGLTTAGVDWLFARQLPAHLQERGLRDVAAESDVVRFEGGSALAELLTLTVRQAQGAGLTGEATPDQIDAFCDLVQRPDAGSTGSRWCRPGAAETADGGRPQPPPPPTPSMIPPLVMASTSRALSTAASSRRPRSRTTSRAVLPSFMACLDTSAVAS